MADDDTNTDLYISLTVKYWLERGQILRSKYAVMLEKLADHHICTPIIEGLEDKRRHGLVVSKEVKTREYNEKQPR